MLIQLANMAETEVTWEHVDAFKALFPNFQLANELFLEEGRDVMVGNVYRRRDKTSKAGG